MSDNRSFFSKEFWSSRDLLQQLAHFSQGLIYSFFISAIFKTVLGWVGAVIGFGVEVYQYFFKDNRDLRLSDRFRDWIFWSLGGALLRLIY